MAIRVRACSGVRLQRRRLRRRCFSGALMSSVMFVLLVMVILYLLRIFLPTVPQPVFTLCGSGAGGGHSGFAEEALVFNTKTSIVHEVTPVIVVDSPSDMVLEEVEFALDVDLPEEIDLTKMVPVDMADWSSEGNDGTGGSGGGSGGGRGSGHGSGNGGGGEPSGGERGPLGQNDDVQIVLVLDASGSMDRLFSMVQRTLEHLVDVLSRCRVNGELARVSIGIVAYGQKREGGEPRLLHGFSMDSARLKRSVASIECDGKKEPFGEAIVYAVEKFPWNQRERSEILKVIFILGNESLFQGEITPEQAMQKAESKGIIVNTVYCDNENKKWRQRGSGTATEPGVHCDEINEEWIQAACGGGEGLMFDLTSDSFSRRGSAIAELMNLEVIPVGSPEEQETAMKEYRSRLPLPDQADYAALNAWYKQYQETAVHDWDAVDMYRRVDGACTLDTLGGRGNMPSSLRDLSDEQLMQRIAELAKKRKELIYKINNDQAEEFVDILLRTLIRQAERCNIRIDSQI